ALDVEECPLLDTTGQVLAEEAVASFDIPPADNSAMDGFAVRAEDVQTASPENPVRLKVLEDLPAGSMTSTPVGKDEAIRIMTGAPMPTGADIAVPVEETEPAGEREILVLTSLDKGRNVRFRGEDVNEGQLVLSAGMPLHPPEIGLLAALGHQEIEIARIPEVAILATGDEIADLGESLTPGRIRNSNSYSLAAQVIGCGAKIKLLGVAADTPESIRQKLEEGFQSDVLLTTGGVSVGDYDYVKATFQEVGAEIKLWQVAIRPGKPLVFGRRGSKPFFGIPGNPVATVVSFEEFVRPALRKMMGHTHLCNSTVMARLEERIEKREGRRYYIRVRLRRENGEYLATTTGPQGSGILTSLVSAHGLAIFSEEITALDAGEIVPVRLLPWTMGEML
ncbi:MAG: molybdopterin molybdotransferase MoeA, partial [Candidatus Binatia bacterium]|nr:molybdopterin molybdotransferase MoeA [Candidatus Binatia bacterium]